METSFKDKLVEEIERSKYLEVFTISDFKKYYDQYETLKKTIARLEKSKYLIRVYRGIYFKPKYFKDLKIYSSYNPCDVCKCIARMNDWSIAPYGDRALNMLGLSTQMPNTYVFASTGPNRKYLIGGFKIIFKHRTDKDLYKYSEITKLVIQALKAIGKKNINDKYISIIKNKLSIRDKKTIKSETKQMMKWIQPVVNSICEVE